MLINMKEVNNRMKCLILGMRSIVAVVFLLPLLLNGCAVSTGLSTNGGESHFLKSCDSHCSEELECISNLCTTRCTEKENTCGSLSKSASCTADGIGGGSVSICDVTCKSNADCRAVDDDLSCHNGFCRGSTSDSDGSSADVADSSSSTDSQTVISLDDARISDSQTSTSDGSPSDAGQICLGSDCPAGIPVTECPVGYKPAADDPWKIATDPIDVKRAVIVGDALTLDVQYSGGCAEHDFALCYDNIRSSRGVDPIQAVLTLTHQANGDVCEALLSKTLTFDLTPIADAYKSYFNAAGGVALTQYGYYSFGELTCEQRTNNMSLVANNTVAAFDSCSSDEDCSTYYIDSSCYAGCQKFISAANQQELESVLKEIDNNICGDYEADGCPVQYAIPCPFMQAACVDGRCTDSSSVPCGCTSYSLSWGDIGGTSDWIAQSSLSSCFKYTHTKYYSRYMMQYFGGVSLFCDRREPICDSETTVNSAVIEAAIKDTDVQSALSKGEVLYGYDARPVDGTVFNIQIGESTIDVGDPCGSQKDCTPIPQGIQKLVDLLNTFDEEQLARPPCDTVPFQAAAVITN
jgi:hypothetical protein